MKQILALLPCRLLPASIQSLNLQGRLMNLAELREFETALFPVATLRLYHYDD